MWYNNDDWIKFKCVWNGVFNVMFIAMSSLFGFLLIFLLLFLQETWSSESWFSFLVLFWLFTCWQILMKNQSTIKTSWNKLSCKLPLYYFLKLQTCQLLRLHLLYQHSCHLNYNTLLIRHIRATDISKNELVTGMVNSCYFLIDHKL